MKRIGRTLALVGLVSGSLWVVAPTAQASECRELTDPGTVCAVQDKFCDYGSTLEEKYGVGWYCID